MRDLQDIQPLSSDLSDRTLTLNLALKGSDIVTLRSCDVFSRDYRNRISFHDSKSIDDVFEVLVADAIRDCLKSLPDGSSVLAMPDFLVELPGLALAGVQIMISEVNEGVRHAIFRFKEFVGAVNRAFLINTGLQDAGPRHSEKLAVNVLEEICLPILNICHTFEAFGFVNQERTSTDLRLRAQEFTFQTELLKRFIYNAEVQRISGLTTPGNRLAQTPMPCVVE